MPRISVEARSAAAFRAGGSRRPPPRHLRAAAKKLWIQIVEDRPVEHFRPGSYELLEQYCDLAIEQRLAIKALRIASPEAYPDRLKACKDLTAMLVALATKLRITVLADIDRRAVGKASERGDGPEDRLLGGSAIFGDRARTQ
jgi:hypothetical protein